jgi:hypothetical protein
MLASTRSIFATERSRRCDIRPAVHHAEILGFRATAIAMRDKDPSRIREHATFVYLLSVNF